MFIIIHTIQECDCSPLSRVSAHLQPDCNDTPYTPGGFSFAYFLSTIIRERWSKSCLKFDAIVSSLSFCESHLQRFLSPKTRISRITKVITPRTHDLRGTRVPSGSVLCVRSRRCTEDNMQGAGFCQTMTRPTKVGRTVSGLSYAIWHEIKSGNYIYPTTC